MIHPKLKRISDIIMKIDFYFLTFLLLNTKIERNRKNKYLFNVIRIFNLKINATFRINES
jgi:hypothetical protein